MNVPKRLVAMAAVASMAGPFALAGCVEDAAPDDAAGAGEIALSIEELEAGTEGYELSLDRAGDQPRRLLLEPVPVGRRTELAVIHPDGVVVDVDVEVMAAAADGSSQVLRLSIVGVDAAGPSAELGSIVGGSLTVERDPRRAVVSLSFDLPAVVGVRADDVARRSLQLPLLVPGPVPTSPLGDEATWELLVRDADGGLLERSVTVIEMTEGSSTLGVDGGGSLAATVVFDRRSPVPVDQSIVVDGLTTSIVTR